MFRQQETKTTLPEFIVADQEPLYIYNPEGATIIRVIIYARVSTDEQAERGTSINNQVDKSLTYAEAYAKANETRIEVVGIFREDYTGKVLDRPELKKVREMLRVGQADALIVYKTNRLDRSEWGVNLLILLQELKQLGVELHYSQDKRRVDLNNPIEALMQSISGWQAGEDHRETVTKLYEGRINRARSGAHLGHGHSPYGYISVSIDNERRFEIDESEAQVVRQIYEWYAYGIDGQQIGMDAIVGKLTELKVPTWKDNRPENKRVRKQRGYGQWSRSSVHKILTNEAYSGLWHYRKKGHSKKDWIPVQVPKIVDSEVWQVVQERIEHNKRFGNRRKHQYLLSGRVTCQCGHKRSGRTAGRYSYYYCHASAGQRLKNCSLPGFQADRVDNLVWTWLEKIILNPKQLRDGMKGYQEAQTSAANPVRHELALIEQTIADKETELEDLMIDFELVKGKRHKAVLASRIEQIENIVNELNKSHAKLQAEIEEKTLTDNQFKAFEEFAAMMRDDVETIRQSYEAKRELINWLNIQIRLIMEDGEKIVYVSGKITAKEKCLSMKSLTYCCQERFVILEL